MFVYMWYVNLSQVQAETDGQTMSQSFRLYFSKSYVTNFLTNSPTFK